MCYYLENSLIEAVIFPPPCFTSWIFLLKYFQVHTQPISPLLGQMKKSQRQTTPRVILTELPPRFNSLRACHRMGQTTYPIPDSFFFYRFFTSTEDRNHILCHLRVCDSIRMAVLSLITCLCISKLNVYICADASVCF